MTKTKLTAKPASASSVAIAQLMQPEHANPLGNVHGGLIMKLADEAGVLVAVRHARRHSVTVFIDSMTFDKPVHVGELIHLRAHLSWVGNSSMEVLVMVEAENPLTGERADTNSGYFVYVALDEDRRPTPVPPLLCETAEQLALQEQGEKRHKYRLSLRRK